MVSYILVSVLCCSLIIFFGMRCFFFRLLLFIRCVSPSLSYRHAILSFSKLVYTDISCIVHSVVNDGLFGYLECWLLICELRLRMTKKINSATWTIRIATWRAEKKPMSQWVQPVYIIYFSLYFDHEMWFLLPYFCQWPPDMILLNQAETPVQMSRLKSHKWNENIISANAKDFESAFYTLRKFVVCVLWSDEKLILFRLFTYSLRRKIIRHSGGRKQNPIFFISYGNYKFFLRLTQRKKLEYYLNVRKSLFRLRIAYQPYKN